MQMGKRKYTQKGILFGNKMGGSLSPVTEHMIGRKER